MYLMKTILIALALALLTGCVIVPPLAPDGVYNPPLNAPYGVYNPPPIAFQTPPDEIVMPDTDDVYVVPDINADLFFWNGFWWRLWEGFWYRSQYYDQGWAYYNDVPSFYFDIDPGWREHYRNHDWYGHRWNYERIPNRQLQQNWQDWQNNRHWERQRTWGVQGYQPRLQQQRQELRQQRQEQYRQTPEVPRPQGPPRVEQPSPDRIPQPKQQPQVPKPQGQPQVQQPSPDRTLQPKQQPQGQDQSSETQQPQRSQPPDRPEGGGERRK